ncbi:hypothetical protein GCM10011584_26510 [Nocardioides phosphati]|uniref:Uncharacterized protein n=1 Tax=Nocardioides phosphati TaxID=1867775 RepID=A0ABQ2NCW5_9ACTN|nr:hypothetical protein [Nocardioides phosphati]GGO91731.1 hypothetical protein GCM10011584_26510 [Nocardioides phosphati]
MTTSRPATFEDIHAPGPTEVDPATGAPYDDLLVVGTGSAADTVARAGDEQAFLTERGHG